MKLLVQFKLLPTQELICRFRKKKEFEGKIKLENKLIERGYDYPHIKNTIKRCKIYSKLL